MREKNWVMLEHHRGSSRRKIKGDSSIDKAHALLNERIDKNMDDPTLGKMMLRAMKEDKYFFRGVNDLFNYYFENLGKSKSDSMVKYGSNDAVIGLTGIGLGNYLWVLEAELEGKERPINEERHERKEGKQ